MHMSIWNHGCRIVIRIIIVRLQMYLSLCLRDYYVCFSFRVVFKQLRKICVFFKLIVLWSTWKLWIYEHKLRYTIMFKLPGHWTLMYGYTMFFLDEAVYVDHGIPYNDGPLEVGELVITKSIDKSPKHVKGNTCLCAMFTV